MSIRFLFVLSLPFLCVCVCTQPRSCTSGVALVIASLNESFLSCEQKYSTAIKQAVANATNMCLSSNSSDKEQEMFRLPEWVACYDQISNTNATIGSICQLTSPPTSSPTPTFIASNYSVENLPFSAALPLFIIHTNGVAVPLRANVTAEDAVYIPSVLYIFSNNQTKNASEIYRAGVKIHGQSSATEYPKNAYALETNDDEHVFGLPKHNKWVLKGPYSDMSLMRDSLAFALSRAMGEYASRTEHVELYLVENNSYGVLAVNYSQHYKGVYILEEKVERDKHRVDVSKADSSKPPAECGYILKVDKMDKEDNRFVLNSIQTNGTNISITYPSPNKITFNQTNYIVERVRKFETLLFGKRWLEYKTSYRSLINRSSFVNYFLLTELVRSADSYWVSTYFSLTGGKNALIHMGPAWDYDLAFGNTGDVVDPPPCTDPGCPDCEACQTEGWQYDVLLKHIRRPHGVAPWFNRLMADSEFRAAVMSRWSELRSSVLNDTALNATINLYQAKLNLGAQQRNFVKWPTLGTRVWPYPNDKHQPTYDLEVGVLRSWLLKRAQWMDVNVQKPFPRDEFYGPGSSCDTTNHCGAGTVSVSATEDSCSPAAAKPNSWNYYDNWQYSKCTSKFNSLITSWRTNNAYLATGGNGSMCSLQSFLFFNGSACPSPVHCYPATDDYPVQSCQSPGWIGPSPTVSPTASPTNSPTRSQPTSDSRTFSPITSPTHTLSPTHTIDTSAPTFVTLLPTTVAPSYVPTTDSAVQQKAPESSPLILIGIGAASVAIVVALIFGFFWCRNKRAREVNNIVGENTLSMDLMDDYNYDTEAEPESSSHAIR